MSPGEKTGQGAEGAVDMRPGDRRPGAQKDLEAPRGRGSWNREEPDWQAKEPSRLPKANLIKTAAARSTVNPVLAHIGASN